MRRTLAGEQGQPVILDNMAKRVIVPTLSKCVTCGKSQAAHGKEGHVFKLDESGTKWRGWYSMRRFLGTQVRMHTESSETSAKALGNSKAVADKHYIKPTEVLPDVRRAVNDALTGLVQ